MYRIASVNHRCRPYVAGRGEFDECHASRPATRIWPCAYLDLAASGLAEHVRGTRRQVDVKGQPEIVLQPVNAFFVSIVRILTTEFECGYPPEQGQAKAGQSLGQGVSAP